MPDLFAPSFAVKINDAPASLDIEKAISEIRVTHEKDTMDTFSLTLVNSYPAMRWTHGADADVFREGTGIKIAMGYVGRDLPPPLFDGVITVIAPSFPEDGIPVVRIQGATRAHRLKQTTQTRTFVDRTDSDIATAIAEALHLKADVDPTDQSLPYVIQFNRTDLDFLLERSRRIDYTLSVDGETLRFKKAAPDKSATVYTLVWAGSQEALAGDRTVMPLRSFTPKVNTMGQPTKVVVRGVNEKTREPIEVAVGAEVLAVKPGAATGPKVAAAAGRELEKVVVRVPVGSRDEARQIATSLFNELAADFVTGSGSTIGLPGLRAGSLVTLGGLGTRFDGDYYVTQTTHTIGPRGYATDFSVRRPWIG
jgi:phage protein D